MPCRSTATPFPLSLVDAETIYEQALQSYEKALGLDHSSTLNSVNKMGLVYKDQGRLSDFETMFRQALQGREKMLGPDHTSTMDTVLNLGNHYLA